MEEIEVVEELEKIWEYLPQDNPVSSGRIPGAKHTIELATVVNGIWLHTVLTVSQRNGFTETTVAVDPIQTIVIDRLRLFQRNTSCGTVLPLDKIRKRVRARENVVEVCLDEMRAALARIQEAPDAFIANMRYTNRSSGESISTVSGGGPGSGKRR